VTALRRTEQAAMAEYGRTVECRMAFVRRQLDDPAAEPCGRCDNCTGRRWDVELDPELVAAAVTYLRSAALVIEPRKQWPIGLEEPRGRIPVERRLEPGRTLSVYGNGGWGSVVKRSKSGDRRLPDELVDAVLRLIEGWAPNPSPAWVTSVPSTTTPELVGDFSRRLAAALSLEYVEAIRRVRPGRPQKEMENSAQQLTNVYGAFEVSLPLPAGPVLLVDDIVDSRWTLTVIGVALRGAGSGEVHPLALAEALST
jgi:ATP-dependent DNA helicase RecQ